MKVAAKWTFAVGLWIAITCLPSAAGQFKHTKYDNAGTNPYRVVCAKFTNSGNWDLAIADYPANNVTVLLGNGDGTFRSPKTFSVPSPVGLAAGDFDGDGKADLVVAESGGTGTSYIGIFLSEGDGSFRGVATYELGIEAGGVTTADFNRDGHLDVAAVTTDGNNGGIVAVFFGSGEGKMAKPTKYKVLLPYGIAAGDLNEDGIPDLAVTAGTYGAVSVLLNKANGRFGTPVGWDAGGGEAHGIAIADLRHDGKQDLVVANASRGMVVLLNNGNGSFGTPNIYVPSFFNAQAPQDCTVADFNLDGVLDIACVANIDDSYLFYGKGDGTFGPSVRIHNTIDYQGGFSIATGDFNNDKTPDLAIPIWTKDKVAIMINAQ